MAGGPTSRKTRSGQPSSTTGQISDLTAVLIFVNLSFHVGVPTGSSVFVGSVFRELDLSSKLVHLFSDGYVCLICLLDLFSEG